MKFLKWILAAVLMLLLVKFGAQQWENSSRSALKPSEVAVAWLSDGRLVVQTEYSVFARNLDNGREDVIFEVPHDRRSDEALTGSCFSTNRWRLHLVSLKAGARSSLGEFYIIELDESGGVGSIDRVAYDFKAQALNDFDCSLAANPAHIEKSIERFNLTNGRDDGTLGQRLFARGDATHVVVCEKTFPVQIAFERKGELAEATLPLRRQRFGGLRSISAGALGHYYLFWSQLSDIGKSENWPLLMWSLNTQTLEQTMVKLPAGPWVGDTEERFQCFSCGCGCYRKAHFVAYKSDVFVRINGIGFSVDSQGIYQFDTETPNNGWRKVVNGPTIGDVRVSADGCRLAYTKKRVGVLDLCQ